MVHPGYAIPYVYVQPGIDGDCLRIDKPAMGTRRVKLAGELHIRGPLHDIIARVDRIVEFQKDQVIALLSAIDLIDDSQVLLALPYTHIKWTAWQLLQYCCLKAVFLLQPTLEAHANTIVCKSHT